MSDENNKSAVSFEVFEVSSEDSSKTLDADGDEVSTEGIKNKIRKMIDGENPNAPLEDERIIQILRTKGIRISSRVIVKYRNQMQIPDSAERGKI